MMLKALKVSVLIAGSLFAALQFVRPARSNPPVNEAQSVEAHLRVSPEVEKILARSCMDCHSNKTEWPLYSYVAPASWLVIDHVNEGRREMNFSEWGRYGRDHAAHLLHDICRTAKQGEMPMSSYTLIHRGAKLSRADVLTLCEWSQAERTRLAASPALQSD